MARCDQCGNDYDKPMTVERGGQTHTFDSFECAIQMMAPTCDACGARIIGHGVEGRGHDLLLRALRGDRRGARPRLTPPGPTSRARSRDGRAD